MSGSRSTQLGDALRLKLGETDCILLTDLLGEQDAIARRVSVFDWYIDQALGRSPKSVACLR